MRLSQYNNDERFHFFKGIKMFLWLKIGLRSRRGLFRWVFTIMVWVCPYFLCILVHAEALLPFQAIPGPMAVFSTIKTSARACLAPPLGVFSCTLHIMWSPNYMCPFLGCKCCAFILSTQKQLLCLHLMYIADNFFNSVKVIIDHID